MEAVDDLVAKLREAPMARREAVKAELVALASGPDGAAVREHLDTVRRTELLEVQWEIEEVLEATTPKKPAAAAPPPPPAPPPPEPPPPADPNRPLTAKDLTLVYDDPRGLMLHKSKVGDRWFATQFNQRTGQPETFELHAQEIEALKTQLAGSPYWAPGAGGSPLAPGGPMGVGPRR